MKKLFLIMAMVLLLGAVQPAQAFWVWTPSSNKWVNPKNEIKETPQEQLDYALGFYKTGEFKEATGELKKLLKEYPRSREAAEAQYYIARMLEEQGDAVSAFKNYQEVIEKYPFSDRFAEIVRRQYEIGTRLLEGRDTRRSFVKTVVGGDYDVIDIFRKVIKNAPYGEYAAPAQYKIALYLQGKQMYQEARDEFEATINDYPDSEWAQAARYQIAVSDAERSSAPQYDQEVTAAAINELEGFVGDYPDAELSSSARARIQELREKEAEKSFIVAEFYQKQRQYAAARRYYSKIVEDYKQTSWAGKALVRIREIGALEAGEEKR